MRARHEEAEAALLEAHAILETARGTDHPLTTGAIHGIVMLYEAWHRPEQAAQWRSRLEPAGDDTPDAAATDGD